MGIKLVTGNESKKNAIQWVSCKSRWVLLASGPKDTISALAVPG